MEKKKLYLNFHVLKTILYIFIDVTVIFLSYTLGFLVELRSLSLNSILFIVGIIAFKIIIASIFGIYKTLLSNFGISDVVRFSIIIVLCNIVCGLVNNIIPQTPHLSVLTFLLITSFELLLSIGSRIAKRLVTFYSVPSENYARTMIVGAGAAAKIVFDETHNNPKLKNNIICFIDNDKEKIGKKYLGKPVVGPLTNASVYIKKYDIKEVIIAIAKLTNIELKDIINIFSTENVKVKRLPILTEMNVDRVLQIKDVSLSELLGREQITFDDAEIKSFIHGKKVLVTGGGGSIGSELVRQIFKYQPSTIILFDIYENGTYDIQQEICRKIKESSSPIKLITIIGSTYNEFRVEEIFNKYSPEIVFHAAAYKHVPLMEDSPVEAIRTNCLGTFNVAKMCDKYKVEKMVLISTDKAVRPTNTMGATKRFAEMVIQYWDNKSVFTSYSAVRFGNVLGSNGSVIPLFRKQIAEGGPVTVTHPEIVRFFMTIPEAVSLILQSGAFATGGEIFILDMGKPIKIVTLAENVIKQCGYTPYKDIDIVFTGLRPGEKLFEELLIDVTVNTKTSNDKIFIEEKQAIYPMDENIKYICQVFDMTDNDEIKECLRKVVVNYTDYVKFNSMITSEKDKVGV